MNNNQPYKILAVCLGNICRSPLAEGLLQRTAKERDLNWEVASGGTGNWHVGQPPDPRSRAVAKQHGLDISQQRAHQVTPADLHEYDLILAMDRKNLANLQAMATSAEQSEKIKLLLTYTELSETAGLDVFDPYWDDNGFEGVYQLLATAAAKVADVYQAQLID